MTTSAKDTVCSVGLLDSSRHATSGWLLVLPWLLGHIGGVNQVVKSLIRSFREGGEFSPQLLITSKREKSGDDHAPEIMESVSMDLWGPLDHRHPIRAMASFLYRF